MSEKNAAQLGQLLRRHRHRTGLSLEDVALAAHLDKSSLSRMESGQIESPDPQKLQRLATVLDTEVEDYFALAGYFTPGGLPTMAPYLRAKFDASPEVARDVENYFSWRTSRSDVNDDNN